MQGYVPGSDGAFAQSGECFAELGEWLASEDAAGLQHGELEDPLDAELNLPEEKHSHGMRKLAAVESARGSIEAAGAAVTRATGVKIGKRQLEELARRCAAHVDAFYLQRVIEPAPDGWALVLTFDGKGIVMLPGALRPATARAAAAAA